jgi:hypothetical protein
MQDNEKTIIDEAAFAKNEAENKTVIEGKGSKLTFAQKAGVAAAGSMAAGSFLAWGLTSEAGEINPEVVTTDRDENLIIVRDDEGKIIEVQSGNTSYTQQNALDNVTTLPTAKNVSDDMSFNQAFAAARAEVGPGGVFYWNGMLYGTYYESEWNAMTVEERANYWNDVQEFAAAHTPPVHDAFESGNESTATSETVEVDTNNEVSTPTASASANDSLFVATSYEVPVEEIEVEVVAEEGTLEVIDVLDINQDGTADAYHIAQDGNHALIFDRNQDGEVDAIAIDSNNDSRFDIIQVDDNFDGQADREEQIDIPYDAQQSSDYLTQNDFDNNADMSDWI